MRQTWKVNFIHLFDSLKECFKTNQPLYDHSVCCTQVGTDIVRIDLSEETTNILHAVIFRMIMIIVMLRSMMIIVMMIIFMMVIMIL